MTAETCKHYKHTSYDVQSLLFIGTVSQNPQIFCSLIYILPKNQNRTWFFVYTAQCMKGELPAKTGLLSTRTKGNKSKEQRLYWQQKWLIFRNACFSKLCKNWEKLNWMDVSQFVEVQWLTGDTGRNWIQSSETWHSAALPCLFVFFNQISFASELAS